MQKADELLRHNQAQSILIPGTEYTQVCVHVQEQLQREANFWSWQQNMC